MRIIVFTLAALAGGLSANVEAAGQKGATASTPQVIDGGQSLPLTVGECRRLGGIDVGGRSDCASGSMCVVNKPNGEVFQLCISKIK